REIKGQKFRRHQNENDKANDARKNKYLKSLGIVILRFANEDVISKTEWVVSEIERKIQDKDSWRS
ncbi:MAG: very-short-patch-repair endonuclease, partial [Arcticibacterium sp.]